MIDIQFVRDNPELVKEKAEAKGYDVDIQKLLGLDNERRELLQSVDEIRARRNDNAARMKGGKPEQSAIEEGKLIKAELTKKEAMLSEIEDSFNKALKSVPNMPLENVPFGKTEDDNQVVYEWGDKPNFDFEPKNHAEIAETKDWLDKERAARVSGARFAYIKGDLVKLQFALLFWISDVLTDEDKIKAIIAEFGLEEVDSKPFNPVLPPAMVRTEPYEASGRLDAEEVTYKLADDDLWMNASAEHSLCTMYMGEVLPYDNLPVRYLGYSTSFRREAGSYGKDTEGIFRMHQFDKLEMESFSTKEQGPKEHLLLVAIQEYILRQLKLPYRKLQKCTADIGKPNAQGVDMDTWLPSQQQYRETHTADYMTDFQARGLKTRTKSTNGLEFVHTNDATALAMGRGMVGIIENYQTVEGDVVIPEVLRTYMGGREKI